MQMTHNSISYLHQMPISTLVNCINSINLWMTLSILQLNKDETEVLILGNDARLIMPYHVS